MFLTLCLNRLKNLHFPPQEFTRTECYENIEVMFFLAIVLEMCLGTCNLFFRECMRAVIEFHNVHYN